VDLDYLVNVSDNFNDFGNFSSFNHNLGGYFGYSYYLFLNNRNLNSSVDDLLYLLNHDDRMVDNLLNFFYPIPVDNFFFNNFNLSDCWHFNLDLHYFLDGFWYFNDLFHCLYNRNWSLDYDFNYFRKSNNLIHNFSGVAIFNNFDRLFNDTVERFNYLHNSFHNLFPNDFYFDDFSDNSFNLNYFLFNDLNFSDFRDCVIDDSFNYGWLFNFNYLLPNNFYFNDFGDLDNSFNYLLDDSGYFHNFFSILGYFNNLFNDVVNYLNNFHWHMDDLFNFLDLDHLNWLFNDSFNWDDLRNFNDSFNNLFNNFFNFNNFGDYSENFQNIVYINNSHNFSIDHSDDSLVNIKHKPGFSFYLLKFF